MKTMKTTVGLCMIAASLILSGCGTTGSSNEELEKLRAENARLTEELGGRDEQFSDIMRDFNDIENNLLAIQQKEKSITEANPQSAETSGDAKARIEAEIQAINELMQANKNQIASLQKKLKNSNIKVAEFEKTIERLNLMIAEKDAEIESLNQKLIALNYQVEGLSRSLDSLHTDINEKNLTLASKDDELSTVYYTMGTKKELVKNGVISADGSFSGARTKTLNFGSSYFTKGDSRTLNTIKIGAKKVKLLSSHPTSSYDLSGDQLSIKDASAFWKASKYCVIEIVKQ